MNLLFPSLARWSDLTLLALRLLTGAFLMHETWDNVSSRARMGEFVQFLIGFRHAGFGQCFGIKVDRFFVVDRISSNGLGVGPCRVV